MSCVLEDKRMSGQGMADAKAQRQSPRVYGKRQQLGVVGGPSGK